MAQRGRCRGETQPLLAPVALGGCGASRCELTGFSTLLCHISTVMYVKYLVCYKRILKSVLRPVNSAVWSEDGIL